MPYRYSAITARTGTLKSQPKNRSGIPVSPFGADGKGIEFLQAFQKIVFQGLERARRCCCTTDYDNIQTRLRPARQNGVDAGTQTTPDTVADDSVANLAAGRKTDADKIVTGFTGQPFADLNHHARGRPLAFCPGDSKKLTPFSQACVTRLCVRLGHADAKTTACP
jgi:hypothetical protein